MDRFDRATGAVWKALGLGSFFIAWLGLAPQYMAFGTAIVTLAGVMVAVVVALLLSFERDVSDNFEEMQLTLDDGIDEIVDAVDSRIPKSPEGDRKMTDGGQRVLRVPGNDGVEMTGSGALGGMIAGGFLGAPFGPGSAVVGGLLGWLVGNEVEYRNRKGKERERLRRLAFEYLKRDGRLDSNDAEPENVVGPEPTEDDGWQFVVVDDSGDRHSLVLYPDENRFEYVGDAP